MEEATAKDILKVFILDAGAAYDDSMSVHCPSEHKGLAQFSVVESFLFKALYHFIWRIGLLQVFF